MATSFLGRSDLPRGLRDNNPGDIRAGDTWQGMVATDPDGFVIFQTIAWGIRAMATDLLNKINKGENTITAIISIYAPPSENDTPAYIAAVSSDMGIDPDTPLPMDEATFHQLIRAIMNHELGENYSAMISDADIDQGISMVKNSFLSLVQATGIALSTAVDQVTGQPGTGTPVLILAGLAIGVWLVSRSKN
jgi:hypothetical protein